MKRIAEKTKKNKLGVNVLSAGVTHTYQSSLYGC